ncbi:hypothetical protein [uncultured Brevundimonas sp.]|uniref:hypothetical protein n=1 Tax=uncultured Brevundimonas sp. TaxID=213418 RepID=UPI0025FE37EE|nr:hypothetical protein [uncultured Brevundimonas sp.]
MKSWSRIFALGEVAFALTLAACGSSEPTPEEVAAQQERHEQAIRQKLADDIVRYPQIAANGMAALKALSVADVRSIDGAVQAEKSFAEIARNVGIVEGAVEAGEMVVSSEARGASAQIKTLLIEKQRQLFPEMRRTFAARMSSEMDGLRANFRAVGAEAKTLRVASPVFVSRDAVMNAHLSLVSNARRFRFSKIEYVYSLEGNRYLVEIDGQGDGDVGA